MASFRNHLTQIVSCSPYPVRLDLIAVISLAYILLFILLHPIFGEQAVVLVFVPVALIAGLFGRLPGIASGVGMSLVNALLLAVLGYQPSLAVYFSQSLFLSVLVILFGLLVGQLSEDRRALRAELAERKAAQERLRRSEQQYRNIVEEQNDLICRYRPDGTLTFVNDAFCRFFDRPAEYCIGLSYHELVLDEDADWEAPTQPGGARRANLDGAAAPDASHSNGKAHLSPTLEHRAAPLSGAISQIKIHARAQDHPLAEPESVTEFRVRRPNGQQAWLNWSTNAIHDRDGRLVEYQSVARDVTERKLNELKLSYINNQLQQAYTALEENRQRLYALFEYSLDAIVFADDNGRFIKVNPAACLLTGYSEDEFYHMSFWTITPADNVDTSLAGWKEFIDAGSLSSEFPIICKDGTVRFTEFRAVANILPGLHVAIARDVTERKQAEARLEYLSAHDGLTGLFNRLYFDQELDRVYNEGGLPMTVIMCDVDGLKRVNDSRGHIYGDELLRRAASILRSCFRPEDVVARLGGDEFVVLLPHTPPEAARRILDRLRRYIEESNAAHIDLPLGMSCGAATLIAGEDPSALVHRADQDMYEEKGRRKVVREAV